MKELFGTISEFPAIHASFGNVTVNSGEGGTTKHSRLSERELPNQHPISAITGLEEALENAGQHFETDETLYLENGVLGVNTATDVEGDNTLPITSAAVYETVGNIEVLLKTI
jgi:hypothetical protein